MQENFYLHVTYWSPYVTSETPKNKLLTPDKAITSEHALLIPGPAWSAMFPQSLHDDIRTLIREASNDKAYDDIWKEKCADLKRNGSKQAVSSSWLQSGIIRVKSGCSASFPTRSSSQCVKHTKLTTCQKVLLQCGRMDGYRKSTDDIFLTENIEGIIRIRIT